MNIVFMGTTDFAVTSLKCILTKNINVLAVVTIPDKPSGRGLHINSSPVKLYAKEQGLPVLQPVNLQDETFIQELQSYNADLFVVVAFRMLPKIIWSIPPKGTINLHASLLPNYRGAAPINWAIINGENETGVTVFLINESMDKGSILTSATVLIKDTYNVEDLTSILAYSGGDLLAHTIKHFDKCTPTIQPEGSYKLAPKIFKKDCTINWNKPAKEVYNFIRGLTAHTSFLGSHKVYKILEARITDINVSDLTKVVIDKSKMFIPCSDYYIEVIKIQEEGKKVMLTKDYLQGHKNLNFKTS